MVKSYKGVKSGRRCEGITVSRRCAAEGASIFGQASPRVVVADYTLKGGEKRHDLQSAHFSNGMLYMIPIQFIFVY